MAASTKDMSAQQAPHAPVRLLIAERTENAAYQFDSLLRDAGIATRPEIIELPMAVDKLANADMLLCNASLPGLQQLLPRLKSIAPLTPIIVINNEDSRLSQAEGMELGAADVVHQDNSQHLVLVVQRELDHVCRNIQFRQMKKALAEAEQRCQLLLQSSRAAIAYVHEGMHIYANDLYLDLFGFEDADDLLGMSVIDLLNSDSAAALKDMLKKFRRDEEESNFDFTGVNSSGETVSGNMTLAAAEYEGEHCLQVTVRANTAAATPAAASLSLVPDQTGTERAPAEAPDGSSPALEQPDVRSSAADDEADDVPVLDTDAIVGTGDLSADADAQVLTNGAETAAAAARDSVEFELELDADESACDHDAHGDGTAEAAAPEAADAADATADAAGAPAADDAARFGACMTLAEFLDASQAIAQQHEDGFVSVFVAQVDGHADLQRAFGLSGVDDACRQVEAGLLQQVQGPFMQISPSQWAMLVWDKTREDAMNVVEGYRASVEAMMFEIREKTVRPTCTFGGSILNMEGFDSISTALEATLDNAFTTLRSTMESADGNTVKLPAFDNAEQEFDDEANRVLALINEAIENQSFTLLFQPIISLRGDSDEHYEVFLRMGDREGKQLAPGEFLRTAIDNGVAGKIDRWVILQSIKMLSSHRANGHNTRLTINLTSNSVADPEFIQWLGVAIKAARLPSDAVIFQITEHDAATYIRQTREFVEGLKNLHCRSSLSRFGLAAEPFEVLGHIPVDFVKLDGTLIETLDKNPDKKGTVTDLVRELQNAGKLTIVPMVESASLLSTLWQAGVNYIQGHYLQEPSTNMDYDFSTDD